MPNREKDTTRLANDLLAWARENGALASGMAAMPVDGNGADFLPRVAQGDDAADVQKVEKTLQRIKVVATAVDAANDRIVVLTKTQVSAASLKVLPTQMDGITIEYVGQAAIEPNPPVIPQAAVGASPRCFVHNSRLACGSSVTAAPIHCAGTLGALVKLADGTLCGLTNNHVTGGCNHTELRMHILCPAPMDADPDMPAPTAIGRHRSFVTLGSGDPRQVQLQEVDGALFEVTLANALTSMQGEGVYDTPTATVAPAGKMRVKKVGRTTGLTTGEIEGVFATPLVIPYEGDRFRSSVYFQNAWLIRGDAGDPFSLSGDSGSLVVTEDGSAAVGLIFAGTTGGEASFIIPIDTVLNSLGATLVGGHGT